MAALYANNGKLSKTELTEVAIISERFVGVNSGGMDQSCSVLGQKDKALIISFFPKLAVEAISIPASESPVFVIAHTLVTSDKHVTAPGNLALF